MRELISEGYKAAMKAGDKRRTATLRSINAAIKDKDIEARGQGKDALGVGDIVVLLALATATPRRRTDRMRPMPATASVMRSDRFRGGSS